MSEKEIELILERIEVLKSFLEEHSLERFREQVLEVKDFLQRFGSLEELLSHLKKLEDMAYSVKDFLTVDEVARYLQITRGTVYRLTSEKELASYKPKGKRLYVSRADLDDWIRRHPTPFSRKSGRRERTAASRDIKTGQYRKGGGL